MNPANPPALGTMPGRKPGGWLPNMTKHRRVKILLSPRTFEAPPAPAGMLFELSTELSLVCNSGLRSKRYVETIIVLTLSA